MRIWILAAAALAAACSGAAQEEAASPAGPSVEQRPREAQHVEPAFEGQTRAPASRSDTQVAAETIATGLSHLWAIEFLPDGRMLVTERGGPMRIVTREGQVGAPLVGLPAVLAERQGGMLDVALSPSFATDRTLYWSYSEARSRNTTATAVARGVLSADETRIENVQVIFRQDPPWESQAHYGSRLVWDREGHLYITLGERSNPDSRVLAQDSSTLIGKVVRINADGTVPADNPFVNTANVRPEIWSTGHRNPQGAALHPETGRLWTIEHGPRGGDELNVPEAGKNYGWPIITYGEEYSGEPIGEGISQREGLEQPIYYWDPVIAPGGMTFYTAELLGDWNGDLVIGSLAGGIVRLELDGERVIGEDRLLSDLGRVRDVVQGPDGALYAVTDEDEARIVRIAPQS